MTRPSGRTNSGSEAGASTGARGGAVVDFASQLIDDPHGLTDEAFERLRTEYEFMDRTFVELIYTVTIVSGYNRLTVALDLAYDHAYPEAWAAEAAAPMARSPAVDD